MIRISQAAIQYLKQKRRSAGLPAGQAVRVYQQARGRERKNAELALTFVDDPEEGDQPLERNGLRFFIAPEVTDAIEVVVIDLTDSPIGRRRRLRARESKR